MKFGYVKVSAISPKLKVADTLFNADAIIESIGKANTLGAEIIVFPELSITGATCGDLFYSKVLLDGALEGVKRVAKSTVGIKSLIFVGMPYKKGNFIYNVAVAINGGKILGIIPKSVIGESEKWFSVCPSDNEYIKSGDSEIPFGNKILFVEETNKSFSVGAEIGIDLNSPLSPSAYHVLNGANLIVNLSSGCEVVGRSKDKIADLEVTSKKLNCGYILADNGRGESTASCVYGGQNVIAECGKILSVSKLFENSITTSEIDLDYIENKRVRSYESLSDEYEVVTFNANRESISISREYEKTPFVPSDIEEKNSRAEFILNAQAEGLAKRLDHTKAGSAVLGLSGGLDSTLAILVAVTAMKKLKRPLKEVIAVTMPCFGTTSRTYQNTIKLAKALGVTLKKIDITKSVTRHLKDLKHPLDVYDVTFENAQARERTQVLMDLANMSNGLVIGTGDLSELALGWATYNGDHMSMYSVNCSVPKTLVRHVVEYYAKKSKGKLKAVLTDILDTPVSPELLPAENGDISQKTEDIVGPYILHDFFLYNMVYRGFTPKKVYFLACKTFKGDFSEQTILKWLKIFVRRFFTQQFKRSCLPDGVKVGKVSLTSNDYNVPSDASYSLYLSQLEEL